EVGPDEIEALRPIADKLTSPTIVSLIRLFTPGPTARGGLRSQLPLEMSVVQAGQALRGAPPGTTSPRPQQSSIPTPKTSDPKIGSPNPSHEAPRQQPIDGSPDAAPVSAIMVPAPTGRPLGDAILFDEASRRWTEILEACGTKNRSVQALLRSAHPLSADSEGLVLGFPYAFHRERIADVKNRAVVEEVIEQVLGQRVPIRTVVSTGRESLVKTDLAQAALDDPLVQAAISMGARIKAVSDIRPEDK
ncbi:MAG TPA: hypothetical protein VKT80_15710, partial [Chloroflexota bacterium]|nr:hypothetical protein [Chloroflexota bacterium]